jgi:hypothetical protein
MFSTPSQDSNIRVRRPTLWYDKNFQFVNCYGGWPYVATPNVATYTSFFHSSDGSKPTLFDRFGGKNEGQFPFPYTRKFGGLWTSSDATYFNLGGVGASAIDPALDDPNYKYQFTESGLLTLDQKTKAWENQTTDFNRVHGEAQYIPAFGKKGIVVFMGGDKPTAQQYNIAGALTPMSTITIYDVASNKFYDQSTTGSAPVERSAFCSVAIGESGTKSYEM